MSQHAVIMGLGSFGGGAGAVRYLLREGWELTVTDARSQEQLGASITELGPAAGDIRWRLGEHNVSDFTGADLVVVNPAVKQPWDNRFVRAAQAAGARLTTEIALTLDALPAGTRCIGVTGSAGKSTTSAMIHAGMIAAGFDARLAGNIGGSLLDSIDTVTSRSLIVLELSSAMLWWLDQLGALGSDVWPEVAVVTNLSQNHLDWHGSFEHYARSKHVLTRRLRRGASAVLGNSLTDWPVPEHARRRAPSTESVPADLATPGEHNRQNAALAIAACEAAGAEIDRAARGVADFRGLPHRLELIRTHHGVRWYNDSKSTTPDATRIAVDAFGGARLHLIVGGSDKGIDLAPIAALHTRAASLLCIGQMGDTIARLAGTTPVGTLEEAVGIAAAKAQPDDVVLLSPGCASFDQFRSYEHRGARFAELVRSLP